MVGTKGHAPVVPAAGRLHAILDHEEPTNGRLYRGRDSLQPTNGRLYRALPGPVTAPRYHPNVAVAVTVRPLP